MLLPLLLLASACTSTVGPFVTDLHSLGNGKLVVERCYVETSTASRSGNPQKTGCTTKIVDVNVSSVTEN